MATEHKTPKYPAGFQSISVTALAVSTLTVPTDARYALVSVYDHEVRMRDNGTSPTSASGYRVSSASGNLGVVELDSAEKLAGFEAIATADGGATLEVLYYKVKA